MPSGFATRAKPNSYACQRCGNTPKEGDILYMQNLGTEDAKNWISCTNQACFEAQGGDKGVKYNPAKGKKIRTTDEKREDAQRMLNTLWPMCYLEAERFYKSKLSQPEFKDIMIFAEVLYKGASMEWARG